MPATRPATISELAAAAQTDPDIAPSSNLDLKHYIRRAETHRKDGKALGSGTSGVGTGDIGTDLELAFIEYARAATLIVEKIPSHRDFTSVLSAEQRANLTANGEDILHQLGRLKSTLVDRYERYARSPSASADSVPAFTLALNRAKPQRKASVQVHAQAQRTVADEAARWRAQREEAVARDAAQAAASTYTYTGPPPSLTPGSSSSTAPSRNPAPYGSSPTSYSPSSSRTGAGTGSVSMPFPVPASLAVSGGHPTVGSHVPQPSALPPSFGRDHPNVHLSPSGTGPAYPSSAGVSFGGSSGVAYPNPHESRAAAGYPASSNATPVSRASSYASSRTNTSTYDAPPPGPMPLRAAHAAYEYEGESTDSEGPAAGGWRAGRTGNASSYPDPARIGFPTPTSTTDDLVAGMASLRTDSARIDGLPPTSYSNIAYPSLARNMSTHQRTQGYVPGAWGSTLPPAAPAFEAFTSPTSGNENRAGVGAAAAISAARAAAASSASVVSGPTTFASPRRPPQQDPAAKAREDALAAQRAAGARADAERAERERDPYPRLRTVVLPLATLPRFLAIASANTARDLETCGLLLGREVAKGGATASGKTRYVVETLLIPKQHATSDTCTMDEEEGVLGFTEERGLITIGWIHTHPSQSCFMSSVDLHTHASFQRMLPESFAVVCAPKSDPNFGIFRLTDPPGLQTVLQCTAKQAFHPHPDVPIYTDADKGHVQMREAALEIVDLR